MKKLLFLFLLLANITFAQSWYTNLDSAKIESKITHKPILLIFTGIGDCSAYQCLDTNILQTKHFNRYMKNKVVLCKIVFPNTKTVPVEIVNYHLYLQQSYNVKGYPTILLITTNTIIGTIPDWCDYPYHFYKDFKRLRKQSKKQF